MNGPGERYLALLASDAAPSDYEQVLQESVDAGFDRPRVERLHRLALQARGVREVGRRRESELAALFETVADLAALKDLDDVLEAIVRRARALLACDVSYLSLNDDERGETYMRITQGIHTEAFRNVRLGFGEGLGGLVAQTARPYATADYFHDERFQHTRTIDGAVGAEELTAILGVPLLLGRAVIGVLYAANHDPRPFGREDVDLLTSFAGHAAVAIDNARRTRESADALADLRNTGELLRRAAEGSQRAADAHDRLAQVVLQGGGLADVAGELQQVLGLAVLVVDAHGTTLASSDADWEPGPDETDAAARALADNATQIQEERSVAPVWAGGAPLAAVLVRGPVDDVNRRILERAATTAALIMAVQRNVAEADSRRRGDLLTDLLLDRAGAGAIAARAGVLGVDLSRPYAVAVAAPVDPVIEQWARDHAAGVGGLCAEVADRLVLVLPDQDPLRVGEQLLERAAHLATSSRRTVGRARPTVGVAGPVHGPEGVRSGFDEAGSCLEALLALGRRGEVTDAASLGFVGLLLGGGAPTGFVRRHLGPVLDYDERRRTSLVQTLQTWLAEDRHLGRTAQTLHVHPNTVTQRLERVGQLLGGTWQAPDRLLELQLALRLQAALRS
ncbi:helix-turn-helix domain-containing protein [Ornithinimicrobium tianjinense]|uniref:GAF domain-containing protein n=1 Tax=Ornithinimicrobium tianjinense TaxID=1195761 RepID=A0A917F3R4_9MICO|nr:GAF domain-containing protein [Ornithinimicrobium tianjinense]GGF45722.1 hypothetical protein GCM10011366_11850 [Ornithinimicrobium tianjinense]